MIEVRELLAECAKEPEGVLPLRVPLKGICKIVKITQNPQLISFKSLVRGWIQDRHHHTQWVTRTLCPLVLPGLASIEECESF